MIQVAVFGNHHAHWLMDFIGECLWYVDLGPLVFHHQALIFLELLFVAQILIALVLGCKDVVMQTLLIVTHFILSVQLVYGDCG